MKRRHLLLLLAAAALTGCPQGGAQGKGGGDKIKIAVAGPFSGSAAAFGDMIRKGATLKADELNAAGGINGKQIELVFEDDAGKTAEAATVSRKLAADESIPIVIGHFNSNCSNTAKEEYNRKGVVSISPGSTNVNVCKGYEWTFRNLYRDDYQGTFLADYAFKVLKAKKAAVFYENDDYGKGLMGAFTEEAKKLGLVCLEPITFQRERTADFKPLVEKIKGEGADVIFVSGLYEAAALITKVARGDLKMSVPILAGDGVMSPEYLKLAGEFADGTLVTTPFLFEAAKDDPKANAFFTAFKQKFEVEPDTWAALTYDALGMAADAIKAVGPDRTKIKDHLKAITSADKAYMGVTGPTFFDAEGDCSSKGAHVAVVKGGKFVAAEQQLKE
ncbi:MAG: ABC transporter substrate-binding protein [Planctomycetota bacterium]